MKLAAMALAVALLPAGPAAAAPVAQGDSVTAGEPIPLSDLQGHAADLRATLAGGPAGGRAPATLLVFWATWCQPCLHEAPEIREIGKFYADRGLRVLSVALNLQEDTPQKVAETARAIGIDYPVLFDSQDAARKAFGVAALPTTLLIDGGGIVRWRGALLPTDINARIKAALESGEERGSR